MLWKLFAICVVYAQMREIADVYSGSVSFSPIDVATWVLSFPAVVIVCCYVFKFSVGERKYWQGFAWIYSAYALMWAFLVLGHYVRLWRYSFNADPVGSSVQLATFLTVFVFKWLAIWRYGREDAIWMDVAEKKPISFSRSEVAKFLGLLRRRRSLQFYAAVFSIFVLTFIFSYPDGSSQSDRHLYATLGSVRYYLVMKSIQGLLMLMAGFCVLHEFATQRRSERRADNKPILEQTGSLTAVTPGQQTNDEARVTALARV